MNETMTERELVERIFGLIGEKREIENSLARVGAEIGECEHRLIQALTAEEKQSTATYEELGYATLVKPAVRASYSKENEEQVFDYLRSTGRGDLVREIVNPRSLSSFVAENLEAGKPVPKCIEYYLQPRLWLYKPDGKRH